MATLISAIAWVKRGVAAEHPQKYNPDDEELARVSELTREELKDAKLDLENMGKLAEEMGVGIDEEDHEEDWEDEVSNDDKDSDQMEVDEKPVRKKDPNDLAEYKLDEYDDDSPTKGGGLFSNIKGLTYYKDNEDDPYITLKEVRNIQPILGIELNAICEQDDDSEKEELQVYSSDNLLVAARTEDEVSQLDIYVYDENNDNLYIHHDLILPSLPLCLEWLDFPPSSSIDSPSKPGNYIAVGTFEPEIEIWSLDTVEGLFPDALLGRPDKTKAHVPIPLGTGKKKKKKTKAREPPKPSGEWLSRQDGQVVGFVEGADGGREWVSSAVMATLHPFHQALLKLPQPSQAFFPERRNLSQ
ncbi:1870_t:CDS:2 [Acaulospora colombiana]|uniref:1870_t:CDS:1 n=1 Tax=Acaulospora colombiana TaxID=27376 RepID=A0ACA9PAN5_9GLOM|nr:1870_t:CDS:2 [Acaulospora colombiana]